MFALPPRAIRTAAQMRAATRLGLVPGCASPNYVCNGVLADIICTAAEVSGVVLGDVQLAPPRTYSECYGTASSCGDVGDGVRWSIGWHNNHALSHTITIWAGLSGAIHGVVRCLLRVRACAGYDLHGRVVAALGGLVPLWDAYDCARVAQRLKAARFTGADRDRVALGMAKAGHVTWEKAGVLWAALAPATTRWEAARAFALWLPDIVPSLQVKAMTGFYRVLEG